MGDEPRNERKLTLAEVQAILPAYSPYQLRRMADAGALPMVRTGGGHRRFLETPVLQMARRAGRRRP